MEIEELLRDSSKRTADFAKNLIGHDPELFKKVLAFSLQDNGVFAMRASRVICHSALDHPELISPYLIEIIRKLPKFKNDGLKRNFTKMISELPANFDEETMSILVNQCFEWITSPAEKVALKVYALDILYNISELYPDIKNELISCIEAEMPRSSSGFNSKGSKLLVKLYKEKDVK